MLLWLFFMSSHAYAQHFTGKVTDSDKNALEGANVIVLGENNRTICYDIADENGVYNVIIPEGAVPVRVNVSYIGYETKTFPFSQLKNNMTIKMLSGKFQLKEVRVKASKIRRQGDTLMYSVAAFKQGQDRSIADVLRKMPGIEVGNDGKVSYQGKSINKFYIEGLDLMGAQYGIANNNISADMIRSVQVLRNHQPIKSLRGVSFSDQAALNLVLKDGSKNVWSGVADVGVGYGNDFLYDCRILGMRFNKKRQTLMMYKNNDTGKDVAAEVNRIVQSSYITDPNEMENGILRLQSVGSADVDQERYKFNHSHLVAGNWLWKLGTDTELRLQGNGFIDNTNMSNYKSTTYLTLADLPMVVEEQSVNNYRSQWKGEVNYQYNGKSSFISNNINSYIDFNKSIGIMLYNNKQTDMLVKPHKQRLTDMFRMTHTTKGKNTYEMNALFSLLNMPGELLTINDMTEKLNLLFISSAATLKYHVKWGKLSLNNELGLSYDRQKIGGSIESGNIDDNIYQLWKTYYAPSIELNFGSHRITLLTRLKYQHQTYKEHQADNVYIEPHVSWRWEYSPFSTLTASAQLQNEPLKGISIYDTPLFTSYRNKTQNRGDLITQHKISLGFSYQYSNPLTGLFLNVRPFYSLSIGNQLYESSLENDVYILKASEKDYDMTIKGVKARVSKSVGWADMVIGLGGTYNINSYSLLIGEQLDKARLYWTNLTLDYSLRPVKLLSIEGKTSLAAYKQENRTESARYPAKNISHWEHHLDVHLFPCEQWMFSVDNELYHNKGKNLGTNYYCDVALSYKAKRWEYSITCTNIFGTSQYKRQTLSNTVETYSITTLRPREYMIKISLDL